MRGVHGYNMALLHRLKSKLETSNSDITKSLPTLQFESALSDEEKKLLCLRERSHATIVSLCAQATYFVHILNEGRHVKNQLKTMNKRSSRILQDMATKDTMLVGIIGCGHLGSQIAHCLLTYSRVRPCDLHISTRRPETLEYLTGRGVECYNNNIKLVSSVNLVFVCVLPSQLALVADEVREYLTSTSIIYSPACCVSARKLKQMFGIDNILKSDCHIEVTYFEKPWNYLVNISSALENKENVQKTNPFSLDKSDCIVSTPVNFGAVMIYAFMNMCSSLGLEKLDSLEALHQVVFGETDKDPVDDRFRVEHFLESTEEHSDKFFPRFDLVKIAENSSPVLQKMLQSEELKHAFASRYWEVFEQYAHFKGYTY